MSVWWKTKSQTWENYNPCIHCVTWGTVTGTPKDRVEVTMIDERFVSVTGGECMTYIWVSVWWKTLTKSEGSTRLTQVIWRPLTTSARCLLSFVLLYCCLLWMNKAKSKDKIYMGCRCYERLQNTKEFTRLVYTVLLFIMILLIEEHVYF